MLESCLAINIVEFASIAPCKMLMISAASHLKNSRRTYRVHVSHDVFRGLGIEVPHITNALTPFDRVR